MKQKFYKADIKYKLPGENTVTITKTLTQDTRDTLILEYIRDKVSVVTESLKHLFWSKNDLQNIYDIREDSYIRLLFNENGEFFDRIAKCCRPENGSIISSRHFELTIYSDMDWILSEENPTNSESNEHDPSTCDIDIAEYQSNMYPFDSPWSILVAFRLIGSDNTPVVVIDNKYYLKYMNTSGKTLEEWVSSVLFDMYSIMFDTVFEEISGNEYLEICNCNSSNNHNFPVKQ